MSRADLRSLARRLRWMFPVFVLLSLGCTGSASAQQPEDRLYVVSHVDVFPPHAAECVKLLEQFAAESRQDAGVVRVEVLQESEHPNHFTILEVWQTRQAFEAHTASEHTKQFRNKLFPWLGSPYDERFNRLPR
jgi:quinol monooxygenase YgiN